MSEPTEGVCLGALAVTGARFGDYRLGMVQCQRELRVSWRITMATLASQNVTQLLLAWGQGDEAARDELIPLVYDTLRRIARHHLRGERPNHTLQTTALINEAYLKLIEQSVSWQNRAHFFGIAARLMRQIMVDYARARLRLKRGGERERITLAAVEEGHEQSADLLALDEALATLDQVDPERGRIVELRFFGGLTIEETAQVMGVSTPTVERGWRAARAWLQTELADSTYRK